MGNDGNTAGVAGRGPAKGAAGVGEARVVTAALVIIGNEVLSGRTRDANTAYLAERLNALGVRLVEVRVVRDDYEAIARAVNDLRAVNDYVFTTGGIGPTHDDITAEAIARAFGRPLIAHPEAVARLERHYAPGDFTPARRRMANTPEGAVLIDNPVSAAPGFQVENVFVMAGVPRIMQAMFESVRHRLVGGEPLLSRTVRCNLPEGRIAERLARLQDEYPDLEIGSYPHMHQAGPSVRLVLRGTDAARLAAGAAGLKVMIAELGGIAEEIDVTAN
jgi:molybdenum cofactor synthesis domain-containing protein